MAVIGAGLTMVLYNGLTVNLAGVLWGREVRAIYRINPTGNGWVSWRPGREFNTMVTIERDKFYLFDTVNEFNLPDAQITHCAPGSVPVSAVIPAMLSMFVYGGTVVQLVFAPWKANLRRIYRININKNGWISFNPDNEHNSLTALEPGNMYLADTLTAFTLQGAQIIGCPTTFGEDTIPLDLSPYLRIDAMVEELGDRIDTTLTQRFLSRELARLGTGGGIIKEDIVVNLPQQLVGGYVNGDIITNGTELTAFVKKLARRAGAIVYVQPTVTMTSSPAQLVHEVGSVISVSLSGFFTRNDAGALTAWEWRRNNVAFAYTQNASYANLTLTTASEAFKVLAYYGEGIAKVDNLGNIDPNDPNRVLAGVRESSPVFYRGVYYLFYGPTATAPATGADARALPNSRSPEAGNTFILNSGTAHTRFAIVVPPGKVLQEAINLDASNLAITSEYALTNANFTATDAGGAAVAGYKLYVKTQAVPYTVNQRHQITIGNG